MKSIINILLREMGYIKRNPIYLVSMVVLPILVVIFFTTMMEDGQPQEMPVGVVDLDNTTTTRALVRQLDAFQTSNVIANYPSVTAARRAMQHDEIYAFLYIPKGTTDALLASRQPKISFYYSSTSITAGSLLFKDLKTVSTLGSAAVGQATMRLKGMTDKQIQTFLQPIALDVHTIGNPWINYNVYLSTMLIPGSLMLFIMLLTAYTLGMEVKHRSGKELLKAANGNIYKAIYTKISIQTILFFLMMLGHFTYMFYVLGFPHQCSFAFLALVALLVVLAGQSFGMLAFGCFPNIRMAMSVCSLWGVLSFSMVGTAFPTFAMDAPLEALSWLFPLRHYFIIYAENIFNGLPISTTFVHFAILIILSAAPVLVVGHIKKVYEEWEYVM